MDYLQCNINSQPVRPNNRGKRWKWPPIRGRQLTNAATANCFVDGKSCLVSSSWPLMGEGRVDGKSAWIRYVRQPSDKCPIFCCPKHTDDADMLQTKAVSLSLGLSQPDPCSLFTGSASRRCMLDNNGVAFWGPPSFARCVSSEYRHLHLSVSSRHYRCVLCAKRKKKCSIKQKTSTNFLS